jgi:hypothetical protein
MLGKAVTRAFLERNESQLPPSVILWYTKASTKLSQNGEHEIKNQLTCIMRLQFGPRVPNEFSCWRKEVAYSIDMHYWPLATLCILVSVQSSLQNMQQVD